MRLFILALLSLFIIDQAHAEPLAPELKREYMRYCADAVKGQAVLPVLNAQFKRDVTPEMCNCIGDDMYNNVFANMTVRQINTLMAGPETSPQRQNIENRFLQSMTRCTLSLSPAQ